MKKTPLLAIWLTFVFAMPMLCVSVCQMYGNDAVYALFENGRTEGCESAKKESESKTERDFFEPYMVQGINSVDMHASSIYYFSESKDFVSICKGVLTQPPEFI
ncbi:MAG: hypothetical protein JKX84_02190 [Flavobacteriales bacterium]|nr:hypothetical protein [Flavobacteriales bacterium]